MHILPTKNHQNAQGMVEFALVLPILLLLVLGVIAFGHLFFVYSSVVSASREAARFGAAVGEVEGSGGTPRYLSCDTIANAAVRVGTFAGVTPATVSISYDEGPGTTGGQLSGNSATCPVGAGGVGSPDESWVKLGDRILVNVTVQYQPIVPLVPIPSFPLTATTARTIIKSLPVGVAPTAVSLCSLTHVTISANHEPSVVGQPVTYTINVISDGADPNPTTADSLRFIDMSSTATCNQLDPPTASCIPPTYMTVGLKDVVADYAGAGGFPCYEPSSIGYTHTVNKADTTVRITGDSPDPSVIGMPVTVIVQVDVVAPGAGTPTGTITVRDTGNRWTCSATLDAARRGICTINPTVLGMIELQAEYSGDANYNPSSSATPHVQHVVYDPATAVPTPGPTLPGPTPTVSPNCPVWQPESVDFTSSDSAFSFGVAFPTGTGNTELDSVLLTWPELPTANLTEIHFAANLAVASCQNQNDATCLFKKKNNSSYYPPSQTFADSMSQEWNNDAAGLSVGGAKYMRMIFDHPLARGDYDLTLRFANGCLLTVDGYRP